MDFVTSSILIMIFIVLYDILVEIYSILFRITGLKKDKAIFQSISLLTGCGYTTSESEIITDNKLRRNIALAAMVTGYTFSVVIISLLFNLISTLNNNELKSSFNILLIAFSIFISLIIIFHIPIFQRLFRLLIEKIAFKILSAKNTKNIITLLDNYGKDAICEIKLNYLPEFLKDKTIAETNIKNLYGINVLILNRNGKTLNVKKNTMFQKNDLLVVFGNLQTIKDLFTCEVEKVEKIIEENIQKHNIINIIDNYEHETMVEITLNKIPDILKDKTLSQSNIRHDHKISILMINRAGMPLIVNKDTVLNLHDTLIVLGPYKNIKDLFEN